MNDWKHAYIYGDYGNLKQFLVDKWPDEESEKGYDLPGEFYFKGSYLLPMEEAGTVTDESGEHMTYRPIAGRADILCLISARAEGVAVYDELSALPDVSLHVSDREEIAELYPEHALGQAIPHIS